VTLGGFTGIHQYCRVGDISFTAISSVVVKDVPPYITVSGNTAKPSGLNKVGLNRNGFDTESIEKIRHAYRTVYREGILLKDAMARLESLAAESEQVNNFVGFIRSSERGITR
ncbi:MAG: acyl-[acyl-carrier-protein]--UDP-N-acetylglucosamine O-acyltransferase, partial [Gammaproteobacteria bacterium]|nr:acyl-[acyl-carrier-protein]--UDP-N-acetylglucosamine O-acyltransferase [Gammaproteobacteria bacterium]